MNVQCTAAQAGKCLSVMCSHAEEHRKGVDSTTGRLCTNWGDCRAPDGKKVRCQKVKEK